MAYTMLTWSIQLHRLADQLIRDEPLPNRNSDVYQRHRRLIQNNMDAARYEILKTHEFFIVSIYLISFNESVKT